MDSKEIASFDSYFAYGFKIFVIVTVVTVIVTKQLSTESPPWQ